MPSVREQFETYHSFAKSSLKEIYGDRLDAAKMFEATTLASSIFINEGSADNPQFVMHAMPNLAQLAPVFGMTATDADGDGHLDLILAQNFHTPQRETGQMDGSLGLLLKGRGTGEFDSVWPTESGILIPEDAKSLVLCDSNNDQRPDFFAGINDGALQLWEHQNSDIEFLSIRLSGKKGNTLATGAMITVVNRDGQKMIHEIQSGSGYLSQQAPRLFVPRKDILQIRVLWPDGTKSTVSEIPPTELLIDQMASLPE